MQTHYVLILAPTVSQAQCNCTFTQKKRVQKRCSCGTIATNGTLFSKGNYFFQYYGQPNSAPRGTVSVPFFLSVGKDVTNPKLSIADVPQSNPMGSGISDNQGCIALPTVCSLLSNSSQADLCPESIF